MGENENLGFLPVHRIRQGCRQREPTTTPSTVYRTLDVLEDVGLVRHAHTPDGREEYHVLPEHVHGHVFCSDCGTTWELRPEAGAAIVEALAGGILCNALVCLAVWLTYSARTTTDRILAIVPPIAAFVAAGFEHSVANMFFLPMAMAIRLFAPASFWTATGASAATYADIDVGAMVANLVPVTIGNVIGGAAIVAGVYWFVYLRKAA